MGQALKYIIDDNGEKSSVLLPIKNWNEINDKYNKLLNKVRVLTGIEKSLEEIKRTKRSGKKLQTLKDFLDQSNR